MVKATAADPSLDHHNRQALAAAVADLQQATLKIKEGRTHGRIAIELFIADYKITGHELLERKTTRHN